jgi:hypothetical protein
MDEREPLQRFEHQPLDETKPSICLVKFLPATEGQRELAMQHFYLEGASQMGYKALSSTWGPLQPTNEIILNQKRSTVRENLWDFL